MPQLWPFQTPNGDVTYPYNTRKALLEALDAQGSEYAGKPGRSLAGMPGLPGLQCLREAFMSIPFTVDGSSPRALYSFSQRDKAAPV